VGGVGGGLTWGGNVKGVLTRLGVADFQVSFNFCQEKPEPVWLKTVTFCVGLQLGGKRRQVPFCGLYVGDEDKGGRDLSREGGVTSFPRVFDINNRCKPLDRLVPSSGSSREFKGGPSGGLFSKRGAPLNGF